MWNGTTMPDQRVIHYWDANHEVGQWFAKQVDGYDGISWDVYYLYGPAATWETTPSPLVSSGSSVYSERETLKMKLSTLLER